MKSCEWTNDNEKSTRKILIIYHWCRVLTPVCQPQHTLPHTAHWHKEIIVGKHHSKPALQLTH